ncbi:MAG TPA: YncE family protein, partial [Stellaceae bacterium]|nr:YncE family protein [Stellaceae bacterium]
MRFALRAAALVAVGLALGSSAAGAQLMIVGNDQKPQLDAQRNMVMHGPGHDTLSILDIANPAMPKIVATIPLDNTVIGPPVNLAIAPSRDIALVANSINAVKKGDKFVPVPDDRLFVIDLTTHPPKVIETLHIGKQPSGMAIAPDGKLALVANRAAGTLTVLSIAGKSVKEIGTVTVGKPSDSVSAVAIAPDGKLALAAKAAANEVALLTIDGDTVTYTKRDLPTGLFPYNVVISPDGKIALTADNGNHGTSDGNAKSIGVIDLAADPPRVINHITVGDSPEGLAISPKGNIAVSVEAQGSNKPTSTWYYHKGGQVSVLKIDGTNVTKIGEVTVGQLPEGVAFSADGSHIYIGNFLDSDLSILKVDGDRV